MSARLADLLPDDDIRLDAPPLRWGIAGPGVIAADFATTLLANTAQRLAAVGSRSPERAAAFAARFDAPVAGGYDVLTRDDVDVVYVATVHPAHAPLALAAIEAGKHVLVEKPFATSAAEAQRVADAARAAGVLAMEAMWTRYVPTYRVLDRVLRDGALGTVTTAVASVGWGVPRGAAGRLTDPATGGGVTLDMGVYPLWFAQFATGRATRIAAFGRRRGEVDEEFAAAIEGGGGRLATVGSTMAATTEGHAEIAGTEGRAVVAGHLVFPLGFDLTTRSGTEAWRDERLLPGRGGLAWQAAALAGYVADGVHDSPLHPLADTIALATAMDTIRAAI
ncbi:Gfo/Idh/MocA family protein [Amnibacterium sp.]|uniref:Gfo/Idh/MocA family protein n=1 Tax=Amnibacterium sp. TaxID=1872496 RepID=UPI003F7BCC8E